MEDCQSIFKRVEKKYRLSDEEYRELRIALADRIAPDEYSSASVMSLYFDTDDDHIIGRSLEKPQMYKEKLRIRSYGVPAHDSMVFAELKKKYDGVVYKRRSCLTWEEARDWLIFGGSAPEDSQINREIEYFMEHYDAEPAALITYDRIAFHGEEDPELRITFDSRIKGRDTALDLTKGAWGTDIIGPNEHLMEIKAEDAYPMWLCSLLSEHEIYSSSFSKYGTFYQERVAQKSLLTGGGHVA